MFGQDPLLYNLAYLFWSRRQRSHHSTVGRNYLSAMLDVLNWGVLTGHATAIELRRRVMNGDTSITTKPFLYVQVDRTHCTGVIKALVRFFNLVWPSCSQCWSTENATQRHYPMFSASNNFLCQSFTIWNFRTCAFNALGRATKHGTLALYSQ